MSRTLTRTAAALATTAAVVTLSPATATAATFDCRTMGDRACLVRIVDADERGATLYAYKFRNGQPTAEVWQPLNQATEDDRYIRETGPRTADGAWDCRWDGDDRCVGRLGGVRYVFPFEDGSPLTPYRSAWQG